MQYAIVNETKTLPTPKTTGLCPGCGADVIAKCGEVKTHHWAHKSLVECDSWWENEGPWHQQWKAEAGGNDPARIEVTIKDPESGRWHRADALSPDGWVIELQHSPISPADIRERESFYSTHAQGMIWIFDHTAPKSHANDRRVLTSTAIVLLHAADDTVSLLNADKTICRQYTRPDIIRILNDHGVSALQRELDYVVEQRKRQKEKEWEALWDAVDREFDIKEARKAEEARKSKELEERRRAEALAYEQEIAKIAERRAEAKRQREIQDIIRQEMELLDQKRRDEEQRRLAIQLAQMREDQKIPGYTLLNALGFHSYIGHLKTHGHINVSQCAALIRSIKQNQVRVSRGDFPAVCWDSKDQKQAERKENVELVTFWLAQNKLCIGEPTMEDSSDIFDLFGGAK